MCCPDNWILRHVFWWDLSAICNNTTSSLQPAVYQRIFNQLIQILHWLVDSDLFWAFWWKPRDSDANGCKMWCIILHLIFFLYHSVHIHSTITSHHTRTHRFVSHCEEVEHCTSQLSWISQLPTTSKHHSPIRILPRNHTNIRIHTHTMPTHTSPRLNCKITTVRGFS